MNSNIKLLEKFYTCFSQRDSSGMADCYHDNIRFSDPVFPALQGDMAKTMWKMLCSQAQEFKLSFHSIEADAQHGRAYWEAKYRFSKTGKMVHNKIVAEFEFQDGKIINHRDDFSFWKWSSMALGMVGLLLGWTPLVKNAVRKQAAKSLEYFSENSS